MNSEHCMREVKDTCYNSFVKKGGLFFFVVGANKMYLSLSALDLMLDP